MAVSKQHIKLIFGLKLKQLRQQKGLSFAQLSKAAGVSISYLNEIEKGKKYPKTDKIISLAEALGVSYDQLVSLKLNKKLAPIAELLNSGILDSLPLDMFGLDSSSLLELISGAPTKVNAFISTIFKISRNYEMKQESFYFAALRSYQEMHDNYFEKLEAAVESFARDFQIDMTPPVSIGALVEVLQGTYGYELDGHTLQTMPDLKGFRSVFLKDQRKLLYNDSLTEIQQAFLMGKEIAFNYLELHERPTTSNVFEVSSFDEVLNNFKASYFSVALLINRHQLIDDLTAFFRQKNWDGATFLKIAESYNASPEMFLHRISNLLPKYFGIDNFFFLRANHHPDIEKDNFHISKELHLSRLHNPHRNDLNEHYCRRWVTYKTLEHLADSDQDTPSGFVIEAQRSQYVDSKHEYFCISIAKPNSPTPNSNVSVTLGIHIDATSRKRIHFLGHEDVEIQQVNETCERCPLKNCAERVAPPSVVQQRLNQEKIRQQLRDLTESEMLSANQN